MPKDAQSSSSRAPRVKTSKKERRSSKRSTSSSSKTEHDVFSDAKRSEIMSRVRSTGNKTTELRLIEEFKTRGLKGWRRNSKLFGRPDFVFPQLRVAVFADGCFWHGHSCRNVTPKDHAEYWRAKIERNRARDAAATARLESLGYVVVRVWECELKRKNAALLDAKLRAIVDARDLSERHIQKDRASKDERGL